MQVNEKNRKTCAKQWLKQFSNNSKKITKRQILSSLSNPVIFRKAFHGTFQSSFNKNFTLMFVPSTKVTAYCIAALTVLQVAFHSQSILSAIFAIVEIKIFAPQVKWQFYFISFRKKWPKRINITNQDWTHWTCDFTLEISWLCGQIIPCLLTKILTQNIPKVSVKKMCFNKAMNFLHFYVFVQYFHYNIRSDMLCRMGHIL